MEFVKKKVFTLEIKSQMQYGILGVSSSVCLLVFLLITTYSLVLANLSYIDVIAVIDQKESDMIDKISDYYSNYQMLNEDMTKHSIQWVRNLMHNYKQRKDNLYYLNSNITNLDDKRIQNVFIDIDDDNNSIDCSTLRYKCFYYKSYQSYHKLPDYFRLLYYALPMLRIVSKFRLIGANQSNVFDKLIINSKELNTTFFYGSNLNRESFSKEDNNFDDLGYKLFYSYITKFNDFENFSNDYAIDRINQNFMKNKIISEIVIKHPGNIMLEISNSSHKYKYTSSFSFQNNFDLKNITLINNQFIKDSYILLEDTITGQWNQDISNQMFTNILNEFGGVDVLVTKSKNNYEVLSNNIEEILSTQEMCEYFRQLQIFKNTKAKTTIKFSQLNENSIILDCFNLDEAKTILQNLMNLNKWLSYKYKRKLKIPLFYNFEKSQADSNYKIVKSLFPDELNLRLYSQNFLIFDKYNFYFFSVSKYSENIYDIIFYKFVAMMMFLIIVNLLLWIIIISIIFLLVIKASHELTTPIKTLIRTLPIINKLDKHHLMKEIEKINYEDDSKINEFFKISKEMIVGGFKVKQEKISIDDYEEVDQISEIKLNNIIINEDKIEGDYNKDVKNLFNFVPSHITGQFEVSNNSICEGSDNVDGLKLNIEDDESLGNLSNVEDELILNRQMRAIDNMLFESESQKELTSGNIVRIDNRNELKSLNDGYYKNRTHPFINLENIFQEKIDKDGIKLALEFSLKKNKDNILYLCYDKIYTNYCD